MWIMLDISTTGALEGADFLASGKLKSLSEQQLVDCDHECDPEEQGSCDAGCNGGLMNSAFEYTLKSGGLMKEKDYPYTAKDHGACKFDKSKVVASVAKFSVVSLYWWSVVPIFVRKEVRRWCVTGWIWCNRICTHKNEGKTILDYQELVGEKAF
ncbi:putative cathepsin L [Helianthus debilis subsp. tardiflorus]